MKKLFTNFIVFAALSVAFSNFTACSNTASTQKGPVLDNTPTASNTANVNANTSTTKTSDYPPVPTGIAQAEIKDVDGNAFKLEDKKGKVVLVNLWATWCGPCRSEMPELVAMQEKYRDKDFEVLGLDVDEESIEEIRAFGKEMKLNYTLGYANEKMVSEFTKLTRQAGIPQSLLINREGQMTGVFFGAGTSAVNKMKAAVEKTVNE